MDLLGEHQRIARRPGVGRPGNVRKIVPAPPFGVLRRLQEFDKHAELRVLGLLRE